MKFESFFAPQFPAVCAAYEPKCYYFEVIETVRKLFLTGGLIFFNPGTGSQIVFSLLLSIASMRVYAYYSPFIKSDQDVIAEAAQWSLFFILFGALLIRLNMDNESLQDRAYFDFMMVVVNMMPIIIPVAQQLGIVKRMKSVPVIKAAVASLSTLFGYEEAADSVAAEAQLKKLNEKFGITAMVKKMRGGREDEETGVGTRVNPLRSGGGTTLGMDDTGGVEMKKLKPHIARAESFNTYKKRTSGNKRGSSGEGAPKLASKDAKPDDVKLTTAKDPPPSNDDDDEKLPSVPPSVQVKPGWTEHIDPATNAPYWTNDETGEATWHKP